MKAKLSIGLGVRAIDREYRVVCTKFYMFQSDTAFSSLHETTTRTRGLLREIYSGQVLAMFQFMAQ